MEHFNKQIIKSQSDKRQYKHITLSNKMRCILISDMEADKSAASLDVRVGSALDPKPLYGTAHFLEHMLFMGTEKYPLENEYSEYILNNGGSNNAFTTMTNTNFHFDISNEGFGEGLDRFAQFFLTPAFKQDSTEREMKAVDSEYRQTLNNDSWKFFMVIQLNAHEKSLFNTFNVGDLESLQQQGIREALLDFHKKYYSANIMRLSISGRHSIEQLEKWATDLFSGVENKDVEIPNLGEVPAYDSQNLSHFYKVVPIKDRDVLSLFWYLPYSQMEYKSQPLRYHSHLFGHEGPNSFLSYLISEGLALELSSSYDHELFSFSNFSIDITLTKKGLAEYQKVIEATFQFAQIVRDKGPQDYVFDELKKLGEIDFTFADKGAAQGYCCKLAGKLQLFKEDQLDDLIKHMYVVQDFDKARIQEMSELLCDPTRFNIYLRSKQFEGQTTQQLKWYHTKYDKAPFSDELLSKIKSPAIVFQRKKLDLPPPNTFLPSNFSILPVNEELSKKPVLLQQWNDSDLWYKKDDKFERPKAKINLKIYTNDCMFGRTPQSRVFVDIWNSILQEYLREFYYMGEMASLKARSTIYHDNINLEWSGYNDTLPLFVEETIKQLKSINFAEQQEYFDQCKEKLIKEWGNFYFEQAYQQAYTTLDFLLINVSSEKKVLKTILEGMTFDQFVKMSEGWLKTGRMLWFVIGNLDKSQAIDMVEKARKVINLIPAEKEDLADVRCISLKNKSHYVYEQELEDKSNENSSLCTYFELAPEDFDLKTKMVNEVLMQYLDEPCFNQLRTVEQLGYVVFSSTCSNRDIMGTRFIIQSPKYSCEYQLNSLNSFLNVQKDKIKSLSDEDFKTQVEAVKTRINEKDYNLQKESARFWGEISTHKYLFDRQEKEIEALNDLTKQELIYHFERLFFSEQTKRIDVELHSEAHKDNLSEWKVKNNETYYYDQFTKRHVIKESIACFKKKMALHPDIFKANYATFNLVKL